MSSSETMQDVRVIEGKEALDDLHKNGFNWPKTVMVFDEIIRIVDDKGEVMMEAEGIVVRAASNQHGGVKLVFSSDEYEHRLVAERPTKLSGWTFRWKKFGKRA